MWTHSPGLGAHVRSVAFEKVPGRRDFEAVPTRRSSGEKGTSEGSASVRASGAAKDASKGNFSLKSLNESAMAKSVDFSKMQARSNIFVKAPATQASYNPNQEAVMSKTLKGLLNFKSMSGR